MSNSNPNYINQPIYVDEMFNFKKNVDSNSNINKMLQSRRSNYIYFKKNCKNWTRPRIYLFCNYTGSSLVPFDNSPYMEDMGNDLYRYLLPSYCTLNKVVFFCDNKSGGTYYKTQPSYIPIGDMYEQPIYYQSPIGYDGIWGDYLTNSFKIAILFNSYIYLKDKDLIDSTDSNGIVKLSIQSNNTELQYDLFNSKDMAGYTIQGPPYQFIDVPFDFKKFTISTKKYKNNNGGTTESVSRIIDIDKICYGIPVIGIITSSNVNPDERGIYIQANGELDYSNKKNNVQDDYDFYIRYNVMSDPRLYALYNLIKDKHNRGGGLDPWYAPYDESNK